MTHLSRIPLPVRVVIVLMMALLLSLVLLRPSSEGGRAIAATNAPIYGKCAGHTQGQIKGDVTLKGREASYAITSLKHGLTSAYDTSSGLSTGRLDHSPVVFTTNVSQATPKLIDAQLNNEALSCTFNFYRTNASGVEINYFRVAITNAHIVTYRLAGAPGGHDEVTYDLTYQHITWTYVDGGIVATATWAPLG